MVAETAVARRGLGLTQTLVVVAIVAVLSGLFFDRMQRLEALTERTAVTVTVQNLRSQLQIGHAMYLANGQIAQFAELADTDPVVLLAYLSSEAPLSGHLADASTLEAAEIDPNPLLAQPSVGATRAPILPAYLGSLDPDRDEVPPGHWYYDARRRSLGYRVRVKRFFVGAGLEGDRVYFRLVANFDDTDGDGRRGFGEAFHGLSLERQQGQDWTL